MSVPAQLNSYTNDMWNFRGRIKDGCSMSVNPKKLSSDSKLGHPCDLKINENILRHCLKLWQPRPLPLLQTQSWNQSRFSNLTHRLPKSYCYWSSLVCQQLGSVPLPSLPSPSQLLWFRWPAKHVVWLGPLVVQQWDLKNMGVQNWVSRKISTSENSNA